MDYVADRPRRLPRKDPVPMSDPGPDDVREAVHRLIDLIQVLLPTRPAVLQAIERCVVEIVTDEMRQRITSRIARFGPEELNVVDALVLQLAQQRGDEPPPEEAP